MFIAHGWFVIQSSQSDYVEPHYSNQSDKIDSAIEKKDGTIRQAFRDWVSTNLDQLIKWQFSEKINNHSGLFQFHTSRNHSSNSTVWPLLEFVSQQSLGSYGIVYVRDEEKEQKDEAMFKIYRVLDGKISEHPDTLFDTRSSPHAFGIECENTLD